MPMDALPVAVPDSSAGYGGTWDVVSPDVLSS